MPVFVCGRSGCCEVRRFSRHAAELRRSIALGGKVDSCSFCGIIKGESDGTFVYRDENTSVFMDIQPVNTGHMLIVPNTHAAYLADLDPEIGAQMFRVAQRVAEALRKSGLRCEGVNLLLADGEGAIQDVFHLHVFPRFEGDGFGLTFPNDYIIKPRRSKLESTAKSRRKAIEQCAATDADKPHC